MPTSTWLSVSELAHRDGPFRLQLWQALQVHHFLSSIPCPQTPQTSLSPFETLFTQEGAIRHQLSLIDNIIVHPAEGFKPSYILQWERKLDRTFTPKQLREIYDRTLQSSVNSKTQEKNYKILSRWYRTLIVLHKFFPTTSNRC